MGRCNPRTPCESIGRQNLRYDYDAIIVGGGLAGGLFAYRLACELPSFKFLLLETSDRIGGEHTWSFHESDISSDAMSWLRPLVTKSWSQQEVRFPAYHRTLDIPYHTIRSDSFHRILESKLGSRVQFGATATRVAAQVVELNGTTRITAHTVVDARGFEQTNPRTVGWQKFVGMDLRLESPHQLNGPIIMDATVEQLDGYRFFYCLPWNETDVLVEDTRYSDGSHLDSKTYRDEIRAFATRQGWKIQSEGRCEIGVLPIPFQDRCLKDGESPFFKFASSGVVTIGVRAGAFNPTTGYSVPDAVRAAESLLKCITKDPDRLFVDFRKNSEVCESYRPFFRKLNWLLFRATPPPERYRVLQHFYRLPKDTVERFYATRLTSRDKFRIFFSKPPVNLFQSIFYFFRNMRLIHAST